MKGRWFGKTFSRGPTVMMLEWEIEMDSAAERKAENGAEFIR